MAKKYINRYNSFCRSLRSLSDSCGADPAATFVLGATAQAFNLTFDLSWKVMKDIIIEHFGIQDFATDSPRETLRTAFSVGLISDDKWMTMLHVRNTLIHDYDGDVARKYFNTITTDFYNLFLEFDHSIEKYMNEK